MPKLKTKFKKSTTPKASMPPALGKLNMLLMSNGALPDRNTVIAELFGASPEKPKTILYVAFALHDQEEAAKRTNAWMNPFGVTLISAHSVADPAALLDTVDGVFITGGNTFRLLDQLQKTGLLGKIREKVLAGMPYMGASAGINVAGPTIMTTNDMPIVQPSSFKAMGLVPFQINPHYVDGKFHYEEDGKIVPYQGETRTDRINQYHEENATPVVGVREGSALRVRGETVELLGGKPATLFRQGETPLEINDAEKLSRLMEKPGRPSRTNHIHPTG